MPVLLGVAHTGLAFPTAGCLVRLFILQHDCGHGSFFKSRAANDVLGRGLSVLTFTPYDRWRKNHAIHHATSGDLDRRGMRRRPHAHGQGISQPVGRSAAPLSHPSAIRWSCLELARSSISLSGNGSRSMSRTCRRKERASVYWTNLGLLVVIALMCWLVGIRQFLQIHVPMLVIAATAGAWLFYVQHHFESTYFRRNDDWSYFDAGLIGSSYYELPAILRWFTADIGLHHVHHLDSQIPNYRLQECFDRESRSCSESHASHCGAVCRAFL